MINDIRSSFVEALAGRWWALVLRGIAAILFGIVAIAMPGGGLLALLTFYGLYALFDGFLTVLLAAYRGGAGERFGWTLLEGLLGIGAGVATFVWPGLTALALAILIGVRSVFVGVAEIAAAIRLRRVIRGEWLLALAGLLSVVFGVLVLLFPPAGALAIVTLIGGYSVVFGVLLIALGVRLHGWKGGENVHGALQGAA